MLDSEHEVTVSEAGFVLDRPVKSLNRSIDQGLVVARKRRRTHVRFKVAISRKARLSGAEKRAAAKARAAEKIMHVAARMLGRAELRFLYVDAALHRDLTDSGRKKVYAAIRQAAADAEAVHVGPIEVKLRDIDRELDERLQRLAKLRDSVEERDGTVLLKGADVPVYAISALQKSLNLGEIAEDCPSLSHEQIQTAFDFAKAYPKVGRPDPATTLKRRLADLAATGALVGELDPSPISPDMFK